jgi:hypothetical protein
MAVTHAPGQAGPEHQGRGPWHHRRRTALVVSAVSLAAAAVVTVPFVVRDLGRSAATPPPTPDPSRHPSPTLRAGQPADLPTLLPAAPGAARGGGRVVVTDDGDRWSLRRVAPAAPGEPVTYDLVVRSHGTTRSVPLPAGRTPALGRTPVSIGALTDGVLVSRPTGDSETWRVYVAWAGRVTALTTRGPVALGVGLTADRGAAYRTWLGPGGRAYTRVGTPRSGRFRVWAWEPSDASAWTPPVLVARSLGTVCLDEAGQSYDRCAG